MNERLTPISFTLSSQAAANGAAGMYVPAGMTITHVSVFATVTGSPSAATIDVQDDGTDIITAQDISANGITALTPVSVAADSVVEIDVNFTGGTSPAVSGEITLWCLAGS